MFVSFSALGMRKLWKCTGETPRTEPVGTKAGIGHAHIKGHALFAEQLKVLVILGVHPADQGVADLPHHELVNEHGCQVVLQDDKISHQQLRAHEHG